MTNDVYTISDKDKARMTKKLQKARDIIDAFLQDEFDGVEAYNDSALDDVLGVIDAQIADIAVYEN